MISYSRGWLALLFFLLALSRSFATNLIQKDERLTGRKLSARVNFNRDAGIYAADDTQDDLEVHDGGSMDDVDEFEGMNAAIEDALANKLRHEDELDEMNHELDYIVPTEDGNSQAHDWEAVRREFGKEAEARAAGAKVAENTHINDAVAFHHDPDTLRTAAQEQQRQKALNIKNSDIPLPTDTPTTTSPKSKMETTGEGGIATGVTADTDKDINHNLASFESTPIPPKLQFRDWQARFQSARHNAIQDHLARIRGETDDNLHPSVSSPHAYEFTSRMGLGYDAPPKNYVAVCMVVRDAHDDIAEWVHYHQKLSISKFYIYDHESTPPLSRVLHHWIDQGIVEYESITPSEYSKHDSGRPQLYGYDKCLQDHGNKHHWLAFIDVDEFLVFQQGPPVQNLAVLLQRYEDYSALAVHWILFGSSGRDMRPVRGTLRSYPLAVPRNHTYHLYVKTIANTKCTIRTTDSPHVFQHNCTRPAVRTNYSPVYNQTADDFPVHSLLALHHYATRSAEEFEIKMARGSGMKRQRGWEYFYFVDSWSIDFNLAGLQVWDDNVVTLGRTLDPGLLEEQLQKYANEEHEEFWGKKEKKSSVDGLGNLNPLDANSTLSIEQVGKAAVAATVNQAKIQADHWGKEEDEDIEVDEHGGEFDTTYREEELV
jgi:hypothetical protein